MWVSVLFHWNKVSNKSDVIVIIGCDCNDFRILYKRFVYDKLLVRGGDMVLRGGSTVEAASCGKGQEAVGGAGRCLILNPMAATRMLMSGLIQLKKQNGR